MAQAAPLHPSDLDPPLGADTVLAALVLAAATGSGLTALLFAGGVLLPSPGGIAMAILGLPLFFSVACPAWLAGLTVLGGPCWWILHRSGVRSPWTAALAGALLTLLAAGGYVALSVPADRHSSQAWMFVAGLTVIGAVAGRVLAKVAYPKKVL
jgi:hypothetical protein